MIIGHATGVAAALALKGGVAVQDIPVSELRKILKSEGAVFEYGAAQQNEALNVIRRRFQPPPRKGPAPWARPAGK